MAATALTQGHGGKSETFLSGGVEATTASGEATKVTSRPGGVEATTFSDEAQSGHVANDSYGTEEPGEKHEAWTGKEEQVAKENRAHTTVKRTRTASPDKRKRLECLVKARKALLEEGDEDMAKELSAKMKPSWAQHRPGRGLHAAERMREAQKPGPEQRPLPWEGIDKIPFTTQEGKEEKLKDESYRWTSTATAGYGAKRMYGASRLCKQEALAAWVTTHENTLDPAEVQRLRATYSLIVAHNAATFAAMDTTPKELEDTVREAFGVDIAKYGLPHKVEWANIHNAWLAAKVNHEVKTRVDAVAQAHGQPIQYPTKDWASMLFQFKTQYVLNIHEVKLPSQSYYYESFEE